MGRTTIIGLEKLQAKLKKNVSMQDVKKVVQYGGQLMQKEIQRNAEFSKGYQTGATKRSVGLSIENGGFTAKSGPAMEYDPYVEWGTRFMEAQPFVKPGFEKAKSQFKRHLDKLTE